MANKKKNTSSIDKPSADKPEPPQHSREKAEPVEQTGKNDTTESGFTRSLGGAKPSRMG